MPEPTISAEETASRAKLGRWLVLGGLVVILILGALAIGVALRVEDVDKKFTYVKDVISIFLPVVAAWVGTVLAFYFSKENFVAASEKAVELARQLTPEQRLQRIPVMEVAIPVEKAGKVVLEKAETDIKVQSDLLQGFFAKNAFNRVLIVTPARVARYILHRSMFDKYIATRALEKPAPKLEDLTLADVLSDAYYKRIALAFGSVNRDAYLAAVKATMDGNPDCSDVVVTDDGTKATPVVGWVTNVIVAERSRL